jgi:ribosomal protein S18 acetylase RimI-like enzyme
MNEVSKNTIDSKASPIVIEQAKPEDAEAICSVLGKTWFDTYPNAEAGITREDIRLRVEGERGERIQPNIERWRNTITTSNDSHTVYVARIDDRVVGMAAPSFIGGMRRVGALYVLPEVQGKGVGSALMQKVLEWHGTGETLYLAVASYNQKAIDFYERFGFKQTRSIEDEGDVYGGKQIPEVEMVRQAQSR